MKSWRFIILSAALVVGLVLPSAAASAQTAATTVPPAVATNVSAVAGNASATVIWQAPNVPWYLYQVTGYQVNVYYQSGGLAPPFHVEVAPSPMRATITGLTNGQGYRFTVQAKFTLLSPPRQIINWGPESALSNVVVPYVPVTPPPLAPPSAPTNVLAVAGHGMATVSWLPASNGGSPITSYVVAYSANVNNVAAVVYPATEGSLFNGTRWRVAIYGLTNGQTYTFYVFAINALGTSAPAASNAVTPSAPATAPSAVTGVSAVAGNGTVTLRWLPAASGGSPIISYIIAYAPHPNAVASVIYPSVSPQLFNGVYWSTTIGGLTNGTAYTFYVYATNAVGVSPAAVANTVIPAAPATAPAAVTDIQVVAGANGTATVSWLPTFTGGSAITRYVVAYSANVNDVAAVIYPATEGWRFNGTRWSVQLSGLTAGKTYTFSVFAINAVGISPAATGNSIILATVPAAVSNLGATAGDGTLALTWAVPSSTGGSAITSYQITASDGVHAPIVTSVSGTGVTLTGLTNGTTYTVTVSAVNALGLGSAASITATPRLLPPTLSVPGGLSVDYGDAVNGTITASSPSPAAHLTLTASGLPTGVTFTDQGNGTGILGGNAQVAAGTYPVSFTASDGHNAPVAKDMTLTVTREEAVIRLFPTAPLSVVLTRPAQTQARSLTIRATVHEVTDPNGYGDIEEAADVTYTLTSLQTGATYSGKALTTGQSIETMLTAKYTFHNIPRGVYALTISVGGNYYQGSAQALVTVSSSAMRGKVTGSGVVAVPGNNASATYQFTAQRGTKGKLSGSLLYTEQGTGATYTVRSTAITALVFKGQTAYIQGKGTLNGVGGYQFVATLVDNHQQGRADRFGLRLIDSSFQPVNHCTFGAVDLTSGQARIQHG